MDLITMLFVGTGALILLSVYGTYVSLIKKRNKTKKHTR